MPDPRLRSDIARFAARLMYERTEREYFTAKRKAASQLGVSRGTHFMDLPSNAEIRDEIEVLARMHEGESRAANLLAMRLTALRLLRLLNLFHPKLIGSVLTGHIRRGSDIDLHCFSDSTSAVTDALESLDYMCHVEHKRIVKHNQARIFTHIHLEATHTPGMSEFGGASESRGYSADSSPPARPDSRFPIEITLYPDSQRNYIFKSSITGKAIERASAAQLQQLLHREHPDLDIEAELTRIEDAALDPYELFALLLEPLQSVKQNPKHHPEGDALYHSLQVFQLALHAKPWDEEFLLAALLHDVGKAIDPHDHVHSGLAALGHAITDRTRFLIEHHMDALHLRDGSGGVGQRQAARLRRHPDFDDLMMLRQLDTEGRQGGVIVPTIAEALNAIRAVAEESYLSD